MNMQKIFDHIVKEEPYTNLNVFLESYETFEEFPIISRYKKLALLKKRPHTEAANILLSISFFVLNSATLYIHSKKNKYEEHFLAITYTDFDFDFENTIEPPIPNLFINPNTTKTASLENLKKKQEKDKSLEIKLVQDRFDACGLRPLFSFYESRFFDPSCNEEIIRVYAVLNQ
ncbi:Imm15 family immunity protein [Pseudomonas monteilii]|uniref:Imm15 family immunity protein n=1 Tax=Pseudomonas monteilii TaxID=76759 RepID=UPI001E39295C|nr:Imm15 family immunity protein [Pseudomonas monteilii]WJR52505.1 Imm15 family immunity protein [Pseudomonas monteilii]